GLQDVPQTATDSVEIGALPDTGDDSLEAGTVCFPQLEEPGDCRRLLLGENLGHAVEVGLGQDDLACFQVVVLDAEQPQEQAQATTLEARAKALGRLPVVPEADHDVAVESHVRPQRSDQVTPWGVRVDVGSDGLGGPQNAKPAAARNRGALEQGTI